MGRILHGKRVDKVEKTMNIDLEEWIRVYHAQNMPRHIMAGLLSCAESNIQTWESKLGLQRDIDAPKWVDKKDLPTKVTMKGSKFKTNLKVEE